MNSDNFSFDSSSQFSLTFESLITSRFSLGLGVSHGKVQISDISKGFGNFSSFGFNSGFFNARELNYKRTTIDLVGKYFILPSSKVNPYVGASIGLGRDRLEYDDSDGLNNAFGNGFNGLGFNENFRRNYATWALLAGAEVKFTKNFGINFEVKHSRGFGSNDDNRQSFIQTPDQLSLNAIGNDLSDASFTSINFGVIGSF